MKNLALPIVIYPQDLGPPAHPVDITASDMITNFESVCRRILPLLHNVKRRHVDTARDEHVVHDLRDGLERTLGDWIARQSAIRLLQNATRGCDNCWHGERRRQESHSDYVDV